MLLPLPSVTQSRYAAWLLLEWRSFVKHMSSKWMSFYKSWLTQHPCIYVEVYEHLQDDVGSQIQQVRGVYVWNLIQLVIDKDRPEGSFLD